MTSSNTMTPPDPMEAALVSLVGNYFRSTGVHWLSRIASRIPIVNSSKHKYGATNGKQISINMKSIQHMDESFQFGLITHEVWHNVLNHCNTDVYIADMKSIPWGYIFNNYIGKCPSGHMSQEVTDFLTDVLNALKTPVDYEKLCLTRPVMHRIHNILCGGIINEIIDRPEHPKGFGKLPIGQHPESEMVSFTRNQIKAMGRKAPLCDIAPAVLWQYLEQLLKEEKQQKGQSGTDTQLTKDNFRISEKELEEVLGVVPNPSVADGTDTEGNMSSDQRNKGQANAKATSNYWSPALQRFLVSRLTKGAGKTSVNRRKLPRDIYQRKHHIEQKLLNLTIMCDVSGSIDQSMLDTFYGNVRRIVSEVQPENLTLVTWDTRICDEVKYHKVTQLPQSFPLRAHGGGTNIHCVGYWLQNRMKEERHHLSQEIVIVFTDMAFNLQGIQETFPKDIEVIWAAFDIYNKAQAVACIKQLPQHSLFKLKEK